MALSQYGFIIIPKEGINPSFKKMELDEDGFFDALPFWEKHSMSIMFFSSIKNILPVSKSWSKDIVLYGFQDGNRLEVYSENNIIESVSFRIDFTSQYESILRQIIEFCILKNLCILDEELRILPLDFLSIKAVIDNSPQGWKYKQLSKNK